MEPKDKDPTPVFLKINDGLWTEKILIPTIYARDEYRVPLKTTLLLADISNSQPLMKDLKTTPVLIFKNKGQKKEETIVLELIGAENF